MINKRNIIGKLGKYMVIGLPMMFMFEIINGQNNEYLRSVYKYSSANYSIKIPDSISEKLPVKTSDDLILSMGNVYYVNFYSKEFSKTEIIFKENQGFKFMDEAKPAFFINDTKNNSYHLFEDSSIIKEAKYFMPTLTKTSTSDTVNGLLSKLYTFKNANNISFKIWISNKIPWCIAPGFYFPDYGGITRIEYLHKEIVWRLDLESYEKTSNSSSTSKKKPVDTKSLTPQVFPFFDVKK